MYKKFQHEHESMILVELINFIGHEVYRAAVLTQYLDEYNRIVCLNNEVISELAELNCNDMQHEIDELTYAIVNSIVLEDPYEKLIEKINSIASRVYPDEFFDEDEALKEQLQKETKRVLKVAKKFHRAHLGWCTDIRHQCMPAGLMPEGNLRDVIAYVDSKMYIPQREVADDGEICETFTSPPIGSIMMFGDEPNYRIHSKKTELLEIPEASLFSRYVKSEVPPKEILKCDKHQYMAMSHLSFIDKKVTHVNFTQSLNVKIDLSTPLSKRDLELLMSNIHRNITSHQNMNMSAAMLVAEDLEQLGKAYQSRDLGEFDLANHMNLTKYPIQGVSSFADIKNALLGLMAWYEHHIEIGVEQTLVYKKVHPNLDDAFAVVASGFIDEETKKVKKGYGFNTIKKGYIVISVAIQRELVKQRDGRCQKRKISTERKKALESAPTVEFYDLHNNDKEYVSTRLESLKSRGYEGVIKQHEDGSIWIVPSKNTE